MTSTETGWRTTAAAKRAEILGKIPQPWRLPEPLPSREEVPDVTGSYIRKFLTPREVDITETDAVGIVAQTSSGAWSAVEVTRAFCHRAALAHQLVKPPHAISIRKDSS